VDKFFSGAPFFVQYDRDMRDVPESILMIPLLANLMPLAWVVGARVHVKTLDRRFYDSLASVRASMSRLYPRLKFSGSLMVDHLTEDVPASGGEHAATLFSGGVDSLATFLRRKAERPYLITIWGGDIGLHQQTVWKKVREHNRSFGEQNGVENLFLITSMRTFLNEAQIAFHFGRYTRGWWPGVQHGIGTVGLCAPLAHSLGIGMLYVPSALPPQLAQVFPDGSSPHVVNRIGWTGTRVRLDGESCTRQDKVRLIAEDWRSRQTSMMLRVCWSNPQYGNCGVCEKCSRTMTALLAEGIDPRRAGFPMHEDTLQQIRLRLPGWLAADPLRVAFWFEVQQRSLENEAHLPEESRSFFAWLQSKNLNPLRRRRHAHRRWIDWIPHSWFLCLKKWLVRPPIVPERGRDDVVKT